MLRSRLSFRELNTAKALILLRNQISVLFLCAVFTSGWLCAYYLSWGNTPPDLSCIIIPSVVGMLITAACYCIGRYISYADQESVSEDRKLFYARLSSARFMCAALAVIIAAVLIIALGTGDIFSGFKLWINMHIAHWNLAHNAGVPLFAGAVSKACMQDYCIILSYLIGVFSAFVFFGCRKKLLIISMLIVSIIQLATGMFAALSFALCLSAAFGLMTTGQTGPSWHTARMWMLSTAMLAVFTFTVGDSSLTAVNNLRHNLIDNIHELRYGRETLPLGKLSDASMLNSEDESIGTLMDVTAAQKKQLYLKGFVGASYSDGAWYEFSDSAYDGGDNRGLFKWLYSRDFDPLTQSAAYYRLTDSTDIHNENVVSVTTDKASRFFMYIPAGCSTILGGDRSREHDLRYISCGICGESRYSFGEISGAKPAELTVAESWLSDPDTADRRKYAESESVYRNFVYNSYTAVDDELKAGIERIFWADYEDDNESIYSLIQQIRRKLEQTAQYDKFPEGAPAGQDPVLWALNTSHSANACMYASAAVMALRAKDIPARYVEGYYIPAAALSEEGQSVEVTTQDAHAWAEVYFDGIGWLPVDVTPGYYYDAVNLQEMIGISDDVIQTAAFEDEAGAPDELMLDDQTERHTDRFRDNSRRDRQAADILLIIRGIMAAIVLICSIILAVMETLRLIYTVVQQKHYDSCDTKAKTIILIYLIPRLLTARGITAHTGWNAEDTDRAVSNKYTDMQTGDYIRINTIMEKSMYGGEELMLSELRTLESFVDRILRTDRQESFLNRLKLRYNTVVLCLYVQKVPVSRAAGD